MKQILPILNCAPHFPEKQNQTPSPTESPHPTPRLYFHEVNTYYTTSVMKQTSVVFFSQTVIVLKHLLLSGHTVTTRNS